jgi:hypothetical protein
MDGRKPSIKETRCKHSNRLFDFDGFESSQRLLHAAVLHSVARIYLRPPSLAVTTSCLNISSETSQRHMRMTACTWEIWPHLAIFSHEDSNQFVQKCHHRYDLTTLPRIRGCSTDDTQKACYIDKIHDELEGTCGNCLGALTSRLAAPIGEEQFFTAVGDTL